MSTILNIECTYSRHARHKSLNVCTVRLPSSKNFQPTLRSSGQILYRSREICKLPPRVMVRGISKQDVENIV